MHPSAVAVTVTTDDETDDPWRVGIGSTHSGIGAARTTLLDSHGGEPGDADAPAEGDETTAETTDTPIVDTIAGPVGCASDDTTGDAADDTPTGATDDATLRDE